MTTKINNNLAKPDHINIVAKLFENKLVLGQEGFLRINVHDVSNIFKINRDNINQDTILMYKELSTTPIATRQLVASNNEIYLFFLDEDNYTLNNWTFDYPNGTFTVSNGGYLRFNISYLRNVAFKIIAINDFPLNEFSISYQPVCLSLSSTTSIPSDYDGKVCPLPQGYNGYGWIQLTATQDKTYNLYNEKGKPYGIKIKLWYF